MVVVVHISALNDTEVLAGRLDTGQARRLGAWWKKLVRQFCSALVLEATEVRLTKQTSKCVLSSEIFY